jgi:hypothetical protein
MAWDKNKPAGSQKIRLSDEEIRENWNCIEDALAREHTFPGTFGGTAGQHTPLLTALQKQTHRAAAAGGTVDAITATFTPTIAALANYLLVCVIAAGANTSTTPTFAPDSLPAKTIVKGNNQALAPGDIPGSGYPAYLLYIPALDKWTLLNPTPLNKYALLQNRQTQNTGGGTSTAGSWQIIPLNTEQEDVDSFVDSSSLPAFSLDAGTYQIRAVCPFYDSWRQQIRLYNVSDSTVVIVGGSSAAGSSGYFNTLAYLFGTISIAATKQFRLEYQVTNGSSNNGLGYPANFGTEVYAQVEIIKLP